MSYCRFSNGDVYLFDNGYEFECCGCRLSEEISPVLCKTIPDAIKHLQAHRAVGHEVPDIAFDRLETERITETTIFGKRIRPERL